MNPGLKHLLVLLALTSSAVLSHAAEFSFPGQTLTVPDGFVVEQVAGPGLVDRPIVGDFDEQGRLYVAESSGSNDPVKEQLEKKPHRILRLEDTDGDGVFDRRKVFAEGLMFPAGTMWLDGSLYVAAPPSIWKLTDTDGDGVANERKEWYDAKTLTGCANDLHGPYLGPDGWIYWCKGAFANQTHELPSGEKFESRAAHIFRRRPEGGGVEPVMTGGMDNPVDVVFTREGERIFNSTFLQHPGGGRRDGLIHAIYGGRYGKAHDVLEDHPKTGDLLPVLTHLGPAAPSGLARYESGQFGAAYRDNLFTALFNLHKVTRHVLRPDGASYRTEDSDFLVSDSTDFHPTDVIEDAEGSLLVIDTGGWYRLCCPTSQLWKPDVLGAIYRVRRADARAVEDPRGLKVDWSAADAAKLAVFLGDARPAVRKRAIRELARRGEGALGTLRTTLTGSKSEEARLSVVWALTQMELPGSREIVRIAFQDKSASVRHAAVHSASVWRDGEAVSGLLELLAGKEAAVKRAAAEALGRIGNKRAVSPLLAEAGRLAMKDGELEPATRILEHSLIYALIEIGNPIETRKGLREANELVRRAALIALDQMQNGGLGAQEVAALLPSPEPLIAETAHWIAGQHADWGGALAGYYRERLGSSTLDENEGKSIEDQLSRQAPSEAVQALLAEIAGSDDFSELARCIALRTMGRARLDPFPARWSAVIESAAGSSLVPVVRAAMSAAGAIPEQEISSGLIHSLNRAAKNEDFPIQLRLEAVSALPAGRTLEAELFKLVRSQLGPEQPLATRTLAIEIFEKAALGEAQLLELCELLKVATPLEISRVAALFYRSTAERVGLALVDALKEAKGLAGLQAEQVRQLLEKYPARVSKAGAELVQLLNQDREEQLAHLSDLLPQLQSGDVRRGQAIFNSSRAACSSCHAIGYLGGDLGPDLTRIGQIRTERDLLEAVIYPSASFVRSYEPVVALTRREEEYSGILRKDSPEEVILATGPGTEVRLNRDEIAELRPGRVSVMPQGLDQQLTKQELADLLAFLKATRW